MRASVRLPPYNKSLDMQRYNNMGLYDQALKYRDADHRYRVGIKSIPGFAKTSALGLAETWLKLGKLRKTKHFQWYRYMTPGSWYLAASLFIHPLLTSAPTIVTFSSSATTICAGETITFDAAGSTYENGISWNFQGGLPATSGAALQEVRFDTPGTYRIELTVRGGACEQIDMKKFHIGSFFM